MTNIIVGVFLFFAGVAVALIWCYRKEIGKLIGLQQSGALDAGTQVVEGLSTLYDQWRKGELLK